MDRVSRETIARAVDDIELPSDAIAKMAQHWELVSGWNARTNLTAVEDPEEAAWLHYRDSLESIRLLPPGAVTDIGSGAGYPGIPIAIAEPDREVCLVEPRRKRASFLEVAVARLGLENVTVLGQRVEGPPKPTPGVVTRATFSDPEDLAHCLNWVTDGGRLIAYRSAPLEEPELVHWYTLRDDRRCLVVWQK